MIFKTAAEAFSYIESFTNLEKSPNLTAREYRLDRMYSLLELFDNPQRAFKSIHVAGSKGKGSTSAFIAAALQANGFKTGLYCSPHVETYKERISEAGSFFDDSLYAETASEMLSLIELNINSDELMGGEPTTFELLTLLSFLIFRKTGCEWAVFETGLGGRLDATNVIIPKASVLTIIELEHTEYLGSTIAEVAGEKAGIIKDGVPVFSADQSAEAAMVFRQKAESSGSRIFFPDDLIESITPAKPDSDKFLQAYKLEYKNGLSYRLNLSSAGDFQLKNASLAISCLKTIMPDSFDPAAGISATTLPGRMEIILSENGRPPVMLDGAHTIQSIRAAAGAFFKTIGNEASDAVLIFGAVEGKDVAGMAEELCPLFDNIIISTPGSFKKNSPDVVFSVFKSKCDRNLSLQKVPSKALSDAVLYQRPILVTGSFYMVAEIRKLIKK